jgi:hypothetical protein
MIKFEKEHADIGKAVSELTRINESYNIPKTYKNYIAFVAWKMEKDYEGYTGGFSESGKNIGQKKEKKEKKAGENM